MKVYKYLIIAAAVCMFPSCSKEECAENPKTGDCICTQIYDPVCGCNNKTYGNACEADCLGITSYTKGACSR
jgi:hypothetical protein